MEKHKPTIILNRIQTPDGTILTSYHVHDYKKHLDKNEEVYMVDGGMSYLRRSANKIPYIELSVYSDAPFEIIRESLHRGTFDDKKQRIWIPLNKMSDEHVKNCISYNQTIGLSYTYINYLYLKELDYREENDISIPDNENRILPEIENNKSSSISNLWKIMEYILFLLYLIFVFILLKNLFM